MAHPRYRFSLWCVYFMKSLMTAINERVDELNQGSRIDLSKTPWSGLLVSSQDTPSIDDPPKPRSPDATPRKQKSPPPASQATPPKKPRPGVRERRAKKAEK
jgi:hypothetical protein